MPLLFAATLFVSAFLLFLIQPMIAQMILPLLGGTPAVWNTCMVFFQAALLAGYGYTHSATTYWPTRRQTIFQLVLLALPFIFFLLPFGIGDWTPPADFNPIWSVLYILLLVVGLPFFVVATSAPLLQRWFASTGHPSAKDPYFLYGASNLGSMLALISYPVFFQPMFELSDQALIWTAGYGFLILLVGACCLVVWQAPRTVELAVSSKPTETAAAPAPAPLPLKQAEQPVTKQPMRRSRGRVVVAAPQAAPVVTTSAPVEKLPGRETALICLGAILGGVALYYGLSALIELVIKRSAPSWFWLVPLNISLVVLFITLRPWLQSATGGGASGISWLRRLRWIALAAIPSSLMLGITTYMTTDIAAVPLFWIVPLALYLLSFIFVFARWPVPWTGTPHTYFVYAQPLILLGVGVLLYGNWGVPTWMIMLSHLIAFFTCVMVCHGELAKDRPAAQHLTEFYLMMSVGGVLGGLFNSLVAPMVFKTGIIEYGVAIGFALYLRPQTHFLAWWRKKPQPADDHSWQEYLLDLGYALCLGLLGFALLRLSLSRTFWPNAENFTVFLYHQFEGIISNRSTALTWARWAELLLIEGIPVGICLCFAGRPVRLALGVVCLMAVNSLLLSDESSTIYANRSFFSVQRVRVDENEYGRYNVLIHGGIDHGRQNLDPKYVAADRIVDPYDPREPRDQPISYFYPTNPIGQVFMRMRDMESKPPFAVVGLGTGTLATYAKPGQVCHIYEIDPAVLHLSEPPDGSEAYFYYLQDARKRGVKLDVILGDGRLKIQEAPENYYQIIVLDAFSSDAIPVHLMTKEAIAMYLTKLRPDGVLIFNITNRYVKLAPILADSAKAFDLICLQQGDDYNPRIPDKFGSDWVIMFRRRKADPKMYAEAASVVSALQPGMLSTVPFAGIAGAPGLDFPQGLPGKLNPWKWERPLPSGGPVWTDRFSDLIRAIHW